METMQKYTKQDIINMVEDEDVEFIRMQLRILRVILRTWQLRQASWRRH